MLKESADESEFFIGIKSAIYTSFPLFLPTNSAHDSSGNDFFAMETKSLCCCQVKIILPTMPAQDLFDKSLYTLKRQKYRKRRVSYYAECKTNLRGCLIYLYSFICYHYVTIL